MTLTTSQREARGLRGRKGVDVWEAFVNLPRDKKRTYARKTGRVVNLGKHGIYYARGN